MFPLRDSAPAKTFAFITWLIIAINCFVFFGELSMDQPHLERFAMVYGFVPANFSINHTIFGIESIFSSMFLHAGWGHLLGNMWFLHVFGNNVEDRLGHLRYLLLYLLSGIGAAFGQLIVDPSSHVPMIGASGAISGVLGSYLIFFPKSTVTTLIPYGFFSRIVEVPAIFYMGFWFLLQLVTGLFSLAGTPENSGGVAFFAHVGGFIAGLVLAKVLGERNNDPSIYYDSTS
jgi:membrane associated rhomboid family serine protease